MTVPEISAMTEMQGYCSVTGQHLGQVFLTVEDRMTVLSIALKKSSIMNQYKQIYIQKIRNLMEWYLLYKSI